MSELEMLKLKVQFLESRLSKINTVLNHEVLDPGCTRYALDTCMGLCKYLSESTVLDSDFRLVSILFDKGMDLKIVDIDIEQTLKDIFVL